MTSPVFTPLQMFYSTSGLPLTDGYIYIGTASQNPQTNPIAVYWDAAGTIPAAQPIRTSGGYPVRNGSPATVFVLATDFSLIVRDKSSKLVFSRLSGNAFSAEWVTYTPAGTGAVATTVQAKLRESVSVKDFGAVGDGATDDTAAIQAAITAVGTQATVYFPAGNYKVTSTILVVNDRVHLVGAGSWATQITFIPTANATCLQLKKATAAVLFQGSVRGFSFYTPDTTRTKIAIDIVDTSGYLIQDITIGGATVGTPVSNYWGGASSVGLRFRGREACKIERIYNYADLPIKISANPNSSISIDHHHFSDLYLVANGNNPVVTIDSGVNLTHVTFDGYQIWAGGNHGLYWNDTTNSGSSIALKICNVRWEQMNGTAGYFVYIAHNIDLQQLTLENLYGSLTANGVYLRKVTNFTLNNVFYLGGLVGLDINSTNNMGEFLNVSLNSNAATAALGATRLFGEYRIGGNVWNLSPSVPSGSGITQSWNPSKTQGFSQLEPQTFTVAAGAIVTFATNSLRGLILITSSIGPVSAVMACTGTTNTTKLLVQSDAGWFGTSIAAANFNLYWNGSNYVLQNTTGGDSIFHVVAMGSGER